MRRLATALVLVVLSVTTALVTTSAAQAAGGVIIYKAYYDSPGTDRGSNSSLNAEYIVLKNTASYTKTITGYRLSDAAGYRYTLPTTRLSSGKTVYIHTGKGTNRYGKRYWGRTWYVWNNSGDKAYLRSPRGTLLDSCQWGSTGSYKYC